MARKLGITSPLDEGVPAIGLGGLRVGVTPLEMAHAYATIANKGVRIGGSVLFHSAGRADPGPDARPDLDRAHPHPGREGRRQPPTAKRVVSARPTRWPPSTRCAACSPSAPASAPYFGRPAAGKTGTTSDYKDAWFAGFTPQRAAAVWVGYVDPAGRWTRSSRATPVSGGTLPGRGLEVVHEPGAPEAAGRGLARAAERLHASRCSSTAATARRSARRTAAATPASSCWPPTRRRRRTRRARAA